MSAAQIPIVGGLVAPLHIAGYPGNDQTMVLNFPDSDAPAVVVAQTFYVGTSQVLTADRQPAISITGNTVTIVYPIPLARLDWRGYHQISWNGEVKITGDISASRNLKNATLQDQTLTVGETAPQTVEIKLGQADLYLLNRAADQALLNETQEVANTALATSDEARALAENSIQNATALLAQAFKGPWRAGGYLAGDQVTQGGNTYRRKANGTDTVFNAAQWDITAVGGSVANGTVDNDKLADSSVDFLKTQYYFGSIVLNRAIVLNLQTKQLILAATRFVTNGKGLTSIAALTLDITTELDTEPTGTKICYYDLVTATVKFKRLAEADQPRSILLFYYRDKAIIAMNTDSIVLINAQGIEVKRSYTPAEIDAIFGPSSVGTAKLSDAAVTYLKTAYYFGSLVLDRAVTLNLQTKQIILSATRFITNGGGLTNIAAVTLDITDELAIADTKICYFDTVTNTLKFKQLTAADQPRSIVLFYYRAPTVVAMNPKSIVLIGADGVEAEASPLANLSVSRDKLAAAAVDFTKTANYFGSLILARALTFNLQTKQVITTVNRSIINGAGLSTIPATTLDVSVELDAAVDTKVCYLDLSNNTLQFKRLTNFTQPRSIVIFYYRDGALSTPYRDGIVLIDASGTEVVPALTSATADLRYPTPTQANRPIWTGSAKIDFNFTTRQITITGGFFMVGKDYYSPNLTKNGGSPSEVKVVDFAVNALTSGLHALFINLTTKTYYAQRAGTFNTIPEGSLLVATWFDIDGKGLSYLPAQSYTKAEIDAKFSTATGFGELTHRLLIPPKMYFVDGIELPIYRSSIVSQSTTALNSFRAALVETNNAANKAPRYRYFLEDIRVRSEELIGGTFGVALAQTGTNKNYYAPVVVQRVSLASLAGKSLTVNMLGDSLTHREMVSQVKTKLAAMGVTATMVGTMANTGGQRGEGRSSWEYENLIGKDNSYNPGGTIVPATGNSDTLKNPFLKVATAGDKAAHPDWCFRNTGANVELSYTLDPDKTGNFYIFDYGYYISANAIAVPDLVTLALFTNDQTQEVKATAISNGLLAIEIIVTQIKAAYPTMKIAIVPTPGWGVNAAYNARWDDVVSEWIEQSLKKIKLLQVTYPNLDVVGIWAHMNRDFNFPYNAAVPLSANNETQVLTVNDAIHWNPEGRMEYAYALASYVANVI